MEGNICQATSTRRDLAVRKEEVVEWEVVMLKMKVWRMSGVVFQKKSEVF